ncbi:MAG: cupin domain-containing protein [Rhizobacter sp.]|nr:cupin domain-containing protein [Chlorobiales bacterium]
MSAFKPASFWIEHLNLVPHVEGGYYRETYRSADTLQAYSLPLSFGTERVMSTAIYFLLEGKSFSALHRIKSDELWHFYAGHPLSIYVLNGEVKPTEIRLGNDPEKGEVFQAVVKAGSWFGSAVHNPVSYGIPPYSLVGCTVAPGFDFRDFEMGEREQLIQTYPQHETLIKNLTR